HVVPPHLQGSVYFGNCETFDAAPFVRAFGKIFVRKRRFMKKNLKNRTFASPTHIDPDDNFLTVARHSYAPMVPYNGSVSSVTVKQMASADFPTRWGQFRIHGFRGEIWGAATGGGPPPEGGAGWGWGV